jgi:hypothetical protein
MPKDDRKAIAPPTGEQKGLVGDAAALTTALAGAYTAWTNRPPKAPPPKEK